MNCEDLFGLIFLILLMSILVVAVVLNYQMAKDVRKLNRLRRFCEQQIKEQGGL